MTDMIQESYIVHDQRDEPVKHAAMFHNNGESQQLTDGNRSATATHDLTA